MMAGCEGMRLLIQADLDGELPPAEALRVAAHLEQCAACAAVQAELTELSTRLRQRARRFPAPDGLRAMIEAALPPASRVDGRRLPIARSAWFGAGFALAAVLAFLFVVPQDGLPDAVVAAHIRALQPGHLTDVLSTDQHTVKPWFDGRIPFAPPVKNLASDGFPLVGGRLDYLDGRTTAVMVYSRGRHLIDLFAWPGDGPVDATAASGSREGYNFRRWSADGMSFWAVSDLNARELAEFMQDWQRG